MIVIYGFLEKLNSKLQCLIDEEQNNKLIGLPMKIEYEYILKKLGCNEIYDIQINADSEVYLQVN